ncbi:MAG TPA: hypothetical protein VLY87_00145 [Flavobacterium sp.]|nr:hypothetical protein [Flavobacterium sp.]
MDKIFKNHPSLESYFKTADGVAFFNMHNAQAHARSLADKRIQTVFKADLKIIEETKASTKPLKAEDVIASIKEVASIEELEEFQNDERKTVKEALATKKAELEALIQEQIKNQE